MPINANALPENPDNLRKLEKELSLPCSEFGEESCIARFIAMSACTFVFGINQGKPVEEALDIADGLFVSIMRGNKIKPISMFNKNDDITKTQLISFKFKYFSSRILDIIVTIFITDSLILIFANRNGFLFPIRKFSFFLLNNFLFIRKLVLNQMTKSLIYSRIK